MQIARRHNLAVIEDCSQAHLSEYNGRLVGTIGDIACFFLASKQSKYISCAGGGITITNNDDYGIRGKLFMDKRWDRSLEEHRGSATGTGKSSERAVQESLCCAAAHTRRVQAHVLALCHAGDG